MNILENIFLGVIGYIKSDIIKIVNGNSTYGSGALTDLRYRLTVNITIMEKHCNLKRGTHFEAKGRLRENDHSTIVLQIPDMSHLTQINNQIITNKEIKKGFLPLKKGVAEEPEPNNLENIRKNRRSIRWLNITGSWKNANIVFSPAFFT